MPKEWPTFSLRDERLPIFFDREFSVNSLVETHRQLLLRSPMGDSHQDRVDVLFKVVSAVKLSFALKALKIRAATSGELAAVESDCGVETLSLSGTRVYMIEGGHSIGYVVATAAFMIRDRHHAANPSGLLYEVNGVEPPTETVYRLV
jgi:hypothetical protein